MTKTLQDFSGILFDVDMTLTNTQRKLSPRLIKALKELSNMRLHLGVCTGRAFVALRETVLPFFPQAALHVTAGGGQVVTSQGKVIWEKLLPEQTCRELHQLGEQYQQMYYIPTMSYGYGSPSFIEKYQGLHTLIPPLKPVAELTKWTAPFLVFINISAEFLKLLQQRQDITIKTSVSTTNFVSFDITPHQITKASGISQWCKTLDITPDQVIGVGDSDNDLEFLDLIGYGVGMGNSTAAVRSRVDRVIGNTDDDGLAVYLETLLKGSPV